MDAALYPRIDSAVGEFPATTVSSGRRLAVYGRALGGSRLTSNDSNWHVLEGQNLHATRDALGVPGTGSQRRPVLPCRGGPADCASRLPGSETVQLGDGGLLPGEEAAVGAILLDRGLPGGAKTRRER